MKIYVNLHSNSPVENGTEIHPYRSISMAANNAHPGDEILVAPGEYRESVNPIISGTEDKRITFRSEVNGQAIISGAEHITKWTNVKGSVWCTRIHNSAFKNYNPYTTYVYGDWYNESYKAHTGDVYLNHKSMYEVMTLEEVINPRTNKSSWDPDFSVYTWYTEQDDSLDETIIYANFQEKNPLEETVELSFRETCFYPTNEQINYITVSGFCIREAATQWAPPTAYQVGMIGPHWAKGWIIEDCEIYESKCSGISLGKYKQESNDNKWSKWKFKDGTQTERECICLAQVEGWSKERIGSHVIRNCNIHDCGQTGIVGHLGGVFSLIENNHIHHINNKQNLAGMEIAGIKMHAALDVIFRNNHIHHCTRGIWLDWQAQGTRVTSNAFHDNTLPYMHIANPENENACGEDLFIEVSHGPTLVDHNIFLSDHAFRLASQGVAFIHNLIAGSIVSVGRGTSNGAKTLDSPRYTPYHLPHRTEVAGFMTILHGDIRFYNNIFVQQDIREGLLEIQNSCVENEWTDNNIRVGTFPYEEYPTWEEYASQFDEYCGLGSAPSDRYYNKLPVWSAGNIYYNGALPMSNEKNASVEENEPIKLQVVYKDHKYILCNNIHETVSYQRTILESEDLGTAFEPEQNFESPDGSSIKFDVDFLGKKSRDFANAGPLNHWDRNILLGIDK